jgi:hypothetical protein
MAEAIIEDVRKRDDEGGGPTKALVIMNYRHAFNDFAFADGTRGDNVGRYLFEAFPGRVANVMLNNLALLPGTTDSAPVSEPIQKGKWDAAFRVAAIEEAGFDFAGSPFGEDPFDYFAFRPHSVRYEDVFDGFVFFRPLAEHRLKTGIPGMFDDGFDAEARRRFAITGRTVADADFEAMIANAAEPLVERYDDTEKIEVMISGWLEDIAPENPATTSVPLAAAQGEAAPVPEVAPLDQALVALDSFPSVASYELDVAITPAESLLAGTAIIRFAELTPWDEIVCFLHGELRVTEVVCNHFVASCHST